MCGGGITTLGIGIHQIMSSELFYHSSLDQSISNCRVYGKFLLLPCFIAIPVLNANSTGPEQTLHSVASDLGLHCLPIIPIAGFPTKTGGTRFARHILT